MHILSLVQQNHIMWKSSVFPTTWKGKILLLLLLSLLLLLLLLFLLLSIPRTQLYLCKIKSLDIFFNIYLRWFDATFSLIFSLHALSYERITYGYFYYMEIHFDFFRYISFKIGDVTFIDSSQFMISLLDKLVSNLTEYKLNKQDAI